MLEDLLKLVGKTAEKKETGKVSLLKIILTFNNSYLIECKPKGIVLAARVICAIEFYSHSISAKSCAINHHANAASKTRIIAGTR